MSTIDNYKYGYLNKICDTVTRYLIFTLEKDTFYVLIDRSEDCVGNAPIKVVFCYLGQYLLKQAISSCTATLLLL